MVIVGGTVSFPLVDVEEPAVVDDPLGVGPRPLAAGEASDRREKDFELEKRKAELELEKHKAEIDANVKKHDATLAYNAQLQDKERRMASLTALLDQGKITVERYLSLIDMPAPPANAG